MRRVGRRGEWAVAAWAVPGRGCCRALLRAPRLRPAQGRAGHRLAVPRGGGRTAQPMWAVESPDAEPSHTSHSTQPAAAAPPDSPRRDSARRDSPRRDSPRRDSPRAPSSLCSSPGLGSGSLAPDSLQAFPGLGSPRESPSIQCDSLECPCCCRCCGSVGSDGACEDSLQAPLTACKGPGRFGARHGNPQASSDLFDSLESLGAQHDSLQSVSSFRSSSIKGDSLESLSSLSNGSTSQHSGLEFTCQ